MKREGWIFNNPALAQGCNKKKNVIKLLGASFLSDNFVPAKGNVFFLQNFKLLLWFYLLFLSFIFITFCHQH